MKTVPPFTSAGIVLPPIFNCHSDSNETGLGFALHRMKDGFAYLAIARVPFKRESALLHKGKIHF